FLPGTVGLLAVVGPAWPWGCEGHQTVALLAKKHLQPAALKKVDDLLGTKPIDPKLPRFCGQTSDVMADVATWADDIRGKRPETAGWHFADIPLSASDNDPSKFCPSSGCVVTAVQNSLGILRSGGSNIREQAEALMFLIHFVGDAHQPLHAATNGDRGG